MLIFLDILTSGDLDDIYSCWMDSFPLVHGSVTSHDFDCWTDDVFFFLSYVVNVCLLIFLFFVHFLLSKSTIYTLHSIADPSMDDG